MFTLCVQMLAYMYACVLCVCTTHRSQKGVSYPLEWELQTVVSQHVGAGS